MSAALLGLRLSLTGAGRLRSLALALAALLAVVVALGTLAAVRSLLPQSTDVADDRRLALVCVAAITIPLAVLVVTVARLSASLRDRRLAGLRLIGLTPTQTRVTAAVESGAAAVVGTVAGYGVFWLLRPALSGIAVAGLDWHAGFVPHAVDQVLTLMATPLLAAGAAALPQRSRPDAALAAARLADRRPPRLWRFLPLGVGLVLCVCVQIRAPRPFFHNSDDAIPWMFAGIILLGVGILLVVPVFVRLIAAVLERCARGPASRIAVRRLQAQPAGVARLVSVLLLGLFLATGARFVVAAWESNGEDHGIVQALHDRQVVGVYAVDASQAARYLHRIARIPGVTGAVSLPVLEDRHGYRAFVGTCGDLTRLGFEVADCRDGQAYALEAYPGAGRTWSVGQGKHGEHGEVVATTPRSLPVLRTPTTDENGALAPLNTGAYLIPPSALAHRLPERTPVEVAVMAPAGRTLADQLQAAHLPAFDAPDFSGYDLAVRLRTLVWTVAGLILALGLLTFAVSSIDAVTQRRKQMTALRLLGLPARTLRRAQWIEAGVPITAGSVLAIGLGALAGSTYLVWGDEHTPMPWAPACTFALIAVGGAVAVAAATVLASNPRIRPDEIRAE